MAKEKAVYAPGELDKVRGRLGNLDPNEAKRMAQVLGGEVGVERTVEPAKQPVRSGRIVRGERGGAGNRADAQAGAGGARAASLKGADSADGSGGQQKPGYRERVKIDRYMAQSEFDIKTVFQAFKSMLVFVGDPADYVNPRFVTKHLEEYYRHIETLVTNTRALCPAGKAGRAEQLRRTSPFYARIIDTIRYWSLDRFTSELARIQSHPRNTTVQDLADILKVVYKPLFILEKLDTEEHIKEAYKQVYRIVFVENASEAQGKTQELIKDALAAFVAVRKEVQYLLYPLLLKLLSDRWLPYDTFFQECHGRYMTFLGVTDGEQLLPSMANTAAAASSTGEGGDKEDGDAEPEKSVASSGESDQNIARENERKAVDRGLKTLESLFPRAGWNRLEEGVDFYPYFQGIFKLKGDYALLSPNDFLIQVAVLMLILEDICIGLRQVRFTMVKGPDGEQEDAAEILGAMINRWQYLQENSFEKEFLPRLSEYCRILENTAESRTSNYARRTYDELQWTKRLYFLPYYRFEATYPQPFQKGDISSVYPEVRTFRRYLTAVAAGIERANRQGGAEKKVTCDTVANPWDAWSFAIPNTVSTRLDAFLGAKQKNNASLIFFALAVVVVLDYLLNDENSWAYNEPGIIPFRSIDNAGITPLRGIDTKIDADQIFKDMVRRLKAKQQQQE